MAATTQSYNDEKRSSNQSSIVICDDEETEHNGNIKEIEQPLILSDFFAKHVGQTTFRSVWLVTMSTRVAIFIEGSQTIWSYSTDRLSFIVVFCYSDMVFVVGRNKQRIPAHRLIISSCSSVFHNMCYNTDMKPTQTSSTNAPPLVITLPDEDYDAFFDMIRCVYSDHVNITLTNCILHSYFYFFILRFHSFIC
jgi:hypothetical protein